jgi:hypothetical protein
MSSRQLGIGQLVTPLQRSLTAWPLAPERDVHLWAESGHPDAISPDHRLDAPRSGDEADQFGHGGLAG